MELKNVECPKCYAESEVENLESFDVECWQCAFVINDGNYCDIEDAKDGK